MQYYYHDGKEQKGPYSITELISCGITRNTKVWKEGLDTWKDAGELDELKALLAPVPPPFKSETPVTPPPFTSSTAANQTGTSGEKKPAGPAIASAAPRKKNSYPGLILAFAFIGVLATAAFFYSQYNQAKGTGGSGYESSQQTYEEKKMSLAEQEATYPQNFLSADGTYRQTLIGKRFAVDINLKSTATVATYKDINIEFIFYSRTDTEIDRQTYTFYEIIRPGWSKNLATTKIDRPAAATKLRFRVVGALTVR